MLKIGGTPYHGAHDDRYCELTRFSITSALGLIVSFDRCAGTSKAFGACCVAKGDRRAVRFIDDQPEHIGPRVVTDSVEIHFSARDVTPVDCGGEDWFAFVVRAGAFNDANCKMRGVGTGDLPSRSTAVPGTSMALSQ